MKLLTVLFLLASQISFAQSTLLKKTINQITFEKDSIQAVFYWVADNIKYDVNKLNKIKEGTANRNTPKFKNKEERDNYKLEQVIKRKKGVCEDYSLLFNAIVKELGYEAYIVSGYTKNEKGKLNRSIGHAWNAVKVGNTWKLYDTTWAAGYVKEEKKFIKKYNSKWYDISPAEMLKTHMPFDPVWQLSDYPIHYVTFNNNELNQKSAQPFDYQQLLEDYAKKEKKEQIQEQLKRSKEIGEGTKLVKRWRKKLNEKITFYDQVGITEILQEATLKSQKASTFFEEYNKEKRKYYKKRKWDIKKAEQSLENGIQEIEAVFKTYKNIETTDRQILSFIKKSTKSLEGLSRIMNKELKALQQLK